MGFDIISWSFERIDLRKGSAGVGSYCRAVVSASSATRRLSSHSGPAS